MLEKGPPRPNRRHVDSPVSNERTGRSTASDSAEVARAIAMVAGSADRDGRSCTCGSCRDWSLVIATLNVLAGVAIYVCSAGGADLFGRRFGSSCNFAGRLAFGVRGERPAVYPFNVRF